MQVCRRIFHPARPGRLLLLALALVWLAGCGLTPASQRAFPVVGDDFFERLRWADYSGAARHLAPELRSGFLQQFADQEALQIVDARLETVEFAADGQRLVAWALVEYYRLPSTVVKKQRLEQEWAYVGAGSYRPGVWQLETPLPELR